jgi:hypothetical protein
MGGVTNFTSVIEARSLGTADIDKMAAAIDKQSAALDGLGKKATAINSHPGFGGFADKIKQGISDPLGAAESSIVSALTAMGPMGAAVAGIGTVLGTLAFAGFKAAESLAAYGQQIENTGLRTGLTTKEIAQFGFAARLVDQDLGVFERTMRGLTAALTDNSAAGAKARDALNSLGVSPRQLNGELKPTGQLLTELSAALGAIPNAIERNKVGMEIFKKAWVEIAPAILKLNEGVKVANREGFWGPSDAQLKQYDKYDEKTTVALQKYDQLIRKAKEWLALNLMPDGEIDRLKGVAENAARRGLPQLNAPGGPSSSIAAALFGADASRVQGDQTAGSALLNAARTRIDATLEGLRAKAAAAKEKYDEAYNSIRTLSGVGAAAAQKEIDSVSVLKKSYEGLNDQLKLAEKTEAARVALLEKAQTLRQSGAGFLQFGSGVGGFIVTNDQISKANQSNRPPSLFGPPERRGNYWNNPFLPSGFGSADLADGISANGSEFISRESTRGPQIGGMSVEQLNARNAGIAGRRNTDEQARLGMLRMEADVTAQLVDLRAGPGGELAAARTVAGIREAALKEEYKITGDINAYREDSRRNEIEFELKLAQLQRKRLDDLRNTGGQLFDAALGGKAGLEQFFSNFIKGQFRTLAGNAFAETFKGSSMNMGLPGKIFQGTIFGKDPLKGATDMNTLATTQNTEAIIAFNARLATSSTGGGGGAISGLAGYGRYLPGGGAWATGDNWVSNSGSPSDTGYTSDGVQRYSPENYGDGGEFLGAGATSSHDLEVGKSSRSAAGGFHRSTAQYGAAAFGTAVGVYGAITSPSTKGKLASGGGALMSAGSAVPPPVGPALMIAGAAMQFASMVMGDPKANEAKRIDQMLSDARYAQPVAMSYSMDRLGRGFDRNTAGEIRIIVETPVTVNAMNAQGFADHSLDIAEAHASVLEAHLSPRLESMIRNIAFRQ